LARFIERKAVQKRRAAGDAEIIGGERRGFVEAAPANGDAGNFMEEFTADAAIVGEQKLE
jgi:hypothetical protein